MYNILLLVSDHHRGDWMPYEDDMREKLGVYDLHVKMPHLKKLMKEGVSFTNCITPSPLCAPARACLASGLNYENCGVKDNTESYPVGQRTFYSVLKDAGYNVGGVGKLDLHKPVRYWGLDGWVDDLGKLGFTHAVDNEGKMDGYGSGKNHPNGPYMTYLYDNELQKIHLNDYDRRSIGEHDTNPTDLPEDAYCDNWLTRNGIELLRNFNRNQPWFLQVNFTGPHNPWDITKRMKDRWKEVEFPQPIGNDNLESEKHNEIRQNFAAMLENIDRNVGILIDEIDKRSELENTIIIYTSDHGDMLGDKNSFGKSVPYRGSVSIPLVICGNGIRRGILSEIPVELQDLAATITDFCDLSMPEAKNSISLKNYLIGIDESPVRSLQTSALLDWKMIVESKQKSIYRKGELAEVYDISKDTWETNNLVDIHCE